MPDTPTSETPAADAPTVRGTMPHPTRTGSIEGIAVLAAVVGVPLGVGLLAWNLPLMAAAVAAYVAMLVICTVAALRRWATLRVELTARAEGLRSWRSPPTIRPVRRGWFRGVT